VLALRFVARAYRRPDATDEEVYAAKRTARIDDDACHVVEKRESEKVAAASPAESGNAFRSCVPYSRTTRTTLFDEAAAALDATTSSNSPSMCNVVRFDPEVIPPRAVEVCQ
jgi:hypothetical protein